MSTMTVRLRKRSYKIVIEKDLNKLPLKLKVLNPGTDAIVVTNPVINSLFGNRLRKCLTKAGLRVKVAIVPDSEKAKSLKEAIKLLRLLSKVDGIRKRLCVVAFGGGVVGDLAGFAASIYKRGIPYIQVPTTLLAQVDSAIGGKTAVDLPTGKNLVGSFYQPKLVYIDISFIKSLSKRDFASGIAEVIKYSVIKDGRLFDYLKANRNAILRREENRLFEIVRRCAKIKADVVSEDEREEKAIRTTLNFGHTVGHAIEAAVGYSDIYTHGEAIAIGMIVASRISNRMGYLSKSDLSRVEEMIGCLGLPTALKRISIERIFKALAYDKKFIHGVTRFVLPIKIGKVIIKERVSEPLIRRELNRLTI
ncbi:MAG: 3-dehydroquinate synthase [Candidatus Omnitrophota bacterium]